VRQLPAAPAWGGTGGGGAGATGGGTGIAAGIGTGTGLRVDFVARLLMGEMKVVTVGDERGGVEERAEAASGSDTNHIRASAAAMLGEGAREPAWCDRDCRLGEGWPPRRRPDLAAFRWAVRCFTAQVQWLNQQLAHGPCPSPAGLPSWPLHCSHLWGGAWSVQGAAGPKAASLAHGGTGGALCLAATEAQDRNCIRLCGSSSSICGFCWSIADLSWETARTAAPRLPDGPSAGLEPV